MHYNEIKNIIKRTTALLLSISPYLFWILLIFSFDSPDTALITIICAVIHETGHELYIYIKHGRLFLPTGRLHGMKLGGASCHGLNYREQAYLYASGPIANIAAALIALPFYITCERYALSFCIVNLATATSNLIPIKGYDGYGILSSVVWRYASAERADTILRSVSFSFTVALCMLSLYLIDRFAEGFWVFAVFIFSLVSYIAEDIKNTNFEE